MSLINVRIQPVRHIFSVRAVAAFSQSLNSVSADPIHDAVRKFDTGTLELILSKSPEIDSLDAEGRTALHIAGTRGYTEIVQRLVAAGANVEALDADKNTPLLSAVGRGHIAIVNVLLNVGAEIDTVDVQQNTPLLIASRKGYPQIVRSLINQGADLSATNRNGSSALHLAARYGQYSVAKTLVEGGADVDAMNRYGATPLYVSNREGHTAISELLIASGANVEAASRVAKTGGPYIPIIEEWRAALASMRLELAESTLGERRLEHIHDRLGSLNRDVGRFAGEAQRRADSVRALLGALGPAPGSNEASEPTAIAERRRLLDEEFSFQKGRINQATTVAQQTSDLMREITQMRQSQFAEHIFHQGPSPLAPDVWLVASVALVDTITEQWRRIEVSLESEEFRTGWEAAFLRAGILSAIAFFGASFIRTVLVRKLGYDPENKKPSYRRKMIATVIEGSARGFPFAVAAAAFYFVIAQTAILKPDLLSTILDMIIASVFFRFSVGVANAALRPTQARWRIAEITDRVAIEAIGIIAFLALVAAIDFVLVRSGWGVEGAEELAAAYSLIVSTTFGILTIRLLRPSLWVVPKRGRARVTSTGKGFLRAIRLAMGVAVVAMPISALLGYASFSRFLTERLMLTGLVISVLPIMNRLVRDMITNAVAPRSRLGSAVEQAFEIDRAKLASFAFWISGLASIVMFIGTAIALLPFWGVNRESLSEFLSSFMSGFEVGETTIAPTDIVAAGLLFIVVLMITRFLQRLLSEQILERTRLDRGIKDSLRTALGYVGVSIAAIVAIGILGIDLTNIAVIIGALSVGIGLGLQDTVKNFMAGVTMLVERPIRIGDKVTIGPHTGFVRRISVRATEIETFDRGSVIVPNSELLSHTVLNWTHRDSRGRVLIPISVAVGTDVLKAQKLLFECAANHKEVLEKPQPEILLHGFGDNSIDFEMRVFMRDNVLIDNVASDIRYAVEAAFRKSGIESPVPKREVAVREMDRPKRTRPNMRIVSDHDKTDDDDRT